METIIVATIGSAGLAVQAWISSRRHRENKQTLGTPNGQGNIVTMQEATLRSLGRLEALLEIHTKDSTAHNKDSTAYNEGH
jgi:hypothetical protein